jgi:hypothetical protein
VLRWLVATLHYSGEYMKLGRSVLAMLACACFSSVAFATDPFSITLNDGSKTVNEGFSSLQDMLSQLTQANLQKLFGSVSSSTSAVTAEIDLRGLTGVQLSYAQNSNTLTLNIPSLGINKQFTGTSRDDSQQLMKQFFKGQGAGSQALLQKMFNGLAASSPIDPVVGNPGSLMGGMSSADFAVGSGGSGSVGASANVGAGLAGAGGAHNFLAMEAHFGSFTQHGYETQLVTLPFSYTHEFSDPRYGLIIDIPLTYMKTNGAEAGSVSMGVGFRFPAAERWTLTPMVRAGAAGSQDLGAAGAIYSGSVMSDYRFLPNQGVNFGLLNMVSYYRTQPIKIASYEVGPNLTNIVYRNGFDLSGTTGFTIKNNPTTWSAQLVRTDFTGDQLFCAYSDDLSVSIGTTQRKGQTLWNALRLGFTYTYADRGIRGFGINTGYTF